MWVSKRANFAPLDYSVITEYKNAKPQKSQINLTEKFSSDSEEERSTFKRTRILKVETSSESEEEKTKLTFKRRRKRVDIHIL